MWHLYSFRAILGLQVSQPEVRPQGLAGVPPHLLPRSWTLSFLIRAALALNCSRFHLLEGSCGLSLLSFRQQGQSLGRFQEEYYFTAFGVANFLLLSLSRLGPVVFPGLEPFRGHAVHSLVFGHHQLSPQVLGMELGQVFPILGHSVSTWSTLILAEACFMTLTIMLMFPCVAQGPLQPLG